VGPCLQHSFLVSAFPNTVQYTVPIILSCQVTVEGNNCDFLVFPAQVPSRKDTVSSRQLRFYCTVYAITFVITNNLCVLAPELPVHTYGTVYAITFVPGNYKSSVCFSPRTTFSSPPTSSTRPTYPPWSTYPPPPAHSSSM
jgi:hypothetical protein